MKSVAIVLGFVGIAYTVAIAKNDQDLESRSGSSPISRPGYYPTFFDPFIGYAGTLPSKKNWIIDLGTSYPGGAERWGNNELEIYTSSTSNIHLTSESTLAFTPRLTAAGWTSARIETQRSDFKAQEGGKLFIEASIKLGDAPASKQQGVWPAFWALGTEFRGNYTNWPAVTEWDFMEVVNGLPTIYSTVHCGYAPGGPCNEYVGLGDRGVPFEKGMWHTVGFEVDRSMCGEGGNGTWEEESLSWFVDGVLKFSVNGSTVADHEAWEMLAHKEHFLLLNVAIGGNWPGPPNNITIDGPSVGMEVNYVGVWNSIG